MNVLMRFNTKPFITEASPSRVKKVVQFSPLRANATTPAAFNTSSGASPLNKNPKSSKLKE